MPPTPADPVIERVDPARLDELESLRGALLARRAEVRNLLALRGPADPWTRRRRQCEGWLADEGSFVLVARGGDAPVAHRYGNEAALRFYERRDFTPIVRMLCAERPGSGPAAGDRP